MLQYLAREWRHKTVLKFGKSMDGDQKSSQFWQLRKAWYKRNKEFETNYYIPPIFLGPLLLIWIGFNLGMDKQLHPMESVDEINYPFSNFNVAEVWQWINNFIPNFNSLRPRQNVCHFADDLFKCIFLNENVRIAIKISLKFVPKGPINNISALLQIMAWRRPGDKPLSEAMVFRLLTHICITWPQWVKRHLITYPCNTSA